MYLRTYVCKCVYIYIIDIYYSIYILILCIRTYIYMHGTPAVPTGGHSMLYITLFVSNILQGGYLEGG